MRDRSTQGEESEFFEVVVLGAGVVGLTTALEIQQRGKGKYRVTVVADVFPGDPNTGVKYTSQWAGAHHVYNSRDRSKYPNDELNKFEKATFETMWKLSEPGSEAEECFLRIPQTEYFYFDREVENSPGSDPLEEMPSYKPIPQQDLPPGALAGCTFQTITIDSPIYLNWLFTRFVGLGGRTVRGHAQHLSQIIEGGIGIFSDRYAVGNAVAKYGVHTLDRHGGHLSERLTPSPSPSPIPVTPKRGDRQSSLDESLEEVIQHSVGKIQARRKKGKVDAVIVCTGLASRFLGGVEDMSMYPLRGQTVIVRAPWVRFGITESGKKDEKGEDMTTYIIPRRSSDVIVGGTRVADDWYPHPREETTVAILTRALKLCPQLAPPEIRASRPPKVDDLLAHVVGEGCGLRPGRKAGIRLESEWWGQKGKLVSKNDSSGNSEAEGENGEGKVLIVYNYGHSGYGYQTSWGTARGAADLLEEGLKNI